VPPGLEWIVGARNDPDWGRWSWPTADAQRPRHGWAPERDRL